MGTHTRPRADLGGKRSPDTVLNLPPTRLDVLALAQRNETVVGGGTLAAWTRLSAECHESWLADSADTSRVHWQLAARMGAVHLRGPKPFVDVTVQATLGLVCQRCLGAVQVEVSARRTVRMEPDEATAAVEDATAEEDVLALTPAPDWAAVVEDELLLALPVLALHDICPAGDWQAHTRAVAELPWDESIGAPALPDADLGGPENAHPFAALAKLRTPPR